MVKDIKYIIKRIVIGVGIALILMLFKGCLIADVHASGNNYTIYFENTSNGSYNTSANTNTFLNVSGVFNRISVVSNTNNIQNDGKYELYASIVVGIDRGGLCTSSNFGLRNDFWIGNSRRSAWLSPTTTWNNIDDISVGNNGYCNYNWGSVQKFTSNISSNGVTYDFYFNDPVSINYIRILRFDLVNTGSTTSDAINNMTNQIINNDIQNSQNIINNQNQNTQDIIDNQNQNSQNIINNQNSNTDKEIESQKVCITKEIYYDNSSTSVTRKFLTSNGGLSSGFSGGWKITDFYDVTDFKEIIVTNSYGSTGYNCFYDINKTQISCFQGNGTYTIPNNSKYIKFSIKNDNGSKPTFNIKSCTNGNQAINDSMNDLNNNITDSNYNDVGGDVEDLQDSIGADFTTNSPISDLLLMPFTLLNAYSDGINTSCSSLSLGSLFNTDLVFPCIDIPHYIGNNLWNTIDIIFCIFLTYNLGMLVISIYDSITSLNSGFESLYTPQHGPSSYKPKHGGVE